MHTDDSPMYWLGAVRIAHPRNSEFELTYEDRQSGRVLYRRWRNWSDVLAFINESSALIAMYYGPTGKCFGWDFWAEMPDSPDSLWP